MIPIFKGMTILTLVLIALIISFKLRAPRLIIPSIRKFSEIFIRWIGYFVILIFLVYAIDLRLYSETLKETTINEFGREVQTYKTDNNLIFNSLPDGTIIDMTGNYKNYKTISTKLWYYIYIVFGLLIFWLIYDRKHVIENYKASKIYRFIQKRRVED